MHSDLSISALSKHSLIASVGGYCYHKNVIIIYTIPANQIAVIFPLCGCVNVTCPPSPMPVVVVVVLFTALSSIQCWCSHFISCGQHAVAQC